MGQHTFVVNDRSKTASFRPVGPGVNKHTSVRGTGQATWQLTLKKGTYTLSSSSNASLTKAFVVS